MTATRTVLATATERSLDRYNCDDFDSQRAAQEFLREHPDDPSNLDADRDGIACEHLGGPSDDDPVSTPTPTLTRTPSATQTVTMTAIATATSIGTLTITPTGTITPATNTPTGTQTVSSTPDGSSTPVFTATITRTPSITPTGTITPATNTPTPSRTRTSTRTATATRTPTPTPPDPVQTYTGTGATTTASFTVGGGLTVLRLTQAAGADISVALVDEDGLIHGSVGLYDDATAATAFRMFDDRETVHLDVTGAGGWTVEVDQTSPPASAPSGVAVAGAGEAATRYFSLRQGLAVMKLERTNTTGSGSVALLDAEGFHTISASLAPGQDRGHTVFYVPFDGVALASVQAEDGWTLEVEQPAPPTPLPAFTPVAGTGQVATDWFRLEQGPARLRFNRPGQNELDASVMVWSTDGELVASDHVPTGTTDGAIDMLFHVATAGPHLLDVRTGGSWSLDVMPLVPPSPVPTPGSYPGNGPGLTPFFMLEPGLHVVRLAHSGAGEAQVQLVDVEAFVLDDLGLDAGDGAGARAVWIETPVAALARVQADGDWTVSFERPTPPVTVPAPTPATGVGADVIPFFRLEPGLAVLRASAATPGVVVVELRHADGTFLHEIGLYDEATGATAFQVPAGGTTAVGNVSGSGAWEVRVEQPTPPAVVPTPGTIAGSGMAVSSFFHLEAGLVVLRMGGPTDTARAAALMNRHGEQLFVGVAMPGEELLVVGAVPEAGPYLVAASSGDSWSITLEQPTVDDAADLPVALNGSGRAVSQPFHASGEVSFTFRYDGESFARAVLYDMEGNEVFTEDGPGPFQIIRPIRNLDGVYLLYVEATETWNVAVTVPP